MFRTLSLATLFALGFAAAADAQWNTPTTNLVPSVTQPQYGFTVPTTPQYAPQWTAPGQAAAIQPQPVQPLPQQSPQTYYSQPLWSNFGTTTNYAPQPTFTPQAQFGTPTTYPQQPIPQQYAPQVQNYAPQVTYAPPVQSYPPQVSGYAPQVNYAPQLQPQYIPQVAAPTVAYPTYANPGYANPAYANPGYYGQPAATYSPAFGSSSAMWRRRFAFP